MPLRLYNTLTRKKEAFIPVKQGHLALYTCGPTVYNYAHIGNFRAYLFEDLLSRYFTYRGYRVNHVMNLTDVEDKLIRTCRETGKPLKAIAERFTTAFFEDIDTLGIKRANTYPAATDHIDEMVTLIACLREKGHTYEHNGSIYFRLNTYPEYGKLSRMNLEELRAGASGRVDSDEYDADSARDFVLWKAWVEEDGDVFWETELGKGRPGWHIECSAMSMKYLGETLDIHCGGVDNIFPHHENEIAQSQCATGKVFCKYWLHCAHLVVEGRKMSKSLGNFHTLRDLLDKGVDPMAIRWVLIATHYRQPNNFSFEAVEAALQSLHRIRDFHIRLEELHGGGANLEEEVKVCEDAFVEAMDDDLNISGALAAVFDFIRDVNRRIDRGVAGEEGARNAGALLERLGAVTGVLGAPQDEGVPPDVLKLVGERQEARRNKDFARADAIREQLTTVGWIIEDTPDGVRVKRG